MTLSVFMLFDAILTALIVFLLCYLALSLVNINVYWALLPASASLIYGLWKRLRKNKLKIIEDSYDFLREKLRTAKDYLYSKNPFVEELQEEISEEIKKVQTGTFFDQRKTTVMVGIIMGLCILIVVLAPYNFVLFDFNKAVSDVMKKEDSARKEARITKPEYQLVSVEDDWYGEFSLGELGQEEMQIQLIESNYKLTSDTVQDPEKKDFQDIYPEDVTVSRAGSYKAKSV